MVIADELYEITRETLLKVRGDTLRTLNREIPMLLDAVHALEHGKPHVTKDHVERAVDGLVALRNSLQGKGK